MELNEFVMSTIIGILEGVAGARSRVEGLGGKINPMTRNTGNLVMDEGGNLVRNIEFDIAVTTEDKTAGGGKISVLRTGISGEASSSDTRVSRIKFSVPITLPQGQ